MTPLATATRPATLARRALVVAAAAASVVTLALGARALADDDLTPGPAVGSVPIVCGGYDEAGRPVDPRAATIDTARLDVDGSPIIPAICGGHGPDGTFVGDD